MWSAIIDALVALFKKLFGKPPVDENTQAVETSNKISATTAQTARDTRSQIQQDEIQNAQNTADDATRVRDADSLSDGADAINGAIARANSRARTDR